MLKTTRDGQVWLITQPAHAELAGKMAAHWGNEEFAVPGHFAASADPERLRREVVLAVAEHDNGWWEWEADPPLSTEDGLPQDLGEVLKNPCSRHGTMAAGHSAAGRTASICESAHRRSCALALRGAVQS